MKKICGDQRTSKETQGCGLQEWELIGLTQVPLKTLTQQLVSVDVDDPVQGAPPQLGVGLVQGRVSVRVAYPQEEDQEVEAAHDDQPPSTAGTRLSKSK